MAEKSDSFVQAANEYFDALVKSRFIEMFGNPISNPLKWPTRTLKEVAPPKQYTLSPKEEGNWLLNLDAVQSNTGAILFKNKVLADQIQGGSIITFSEFNVLYSKLRPYLNKVVLPDEPGFGTSELVPLLPNASILTREYLAWMLRSESFVTMISNAVAGAKMPRVTMDTFWKFNVPLPPTELQNQFADFVRQVDKSKLLFQQIVSKYDQLVKSRFIEMFGDPISNPNNWPQNKLNSLVTIERGGSPRPIDAFITEDENGLNWIKIGDANDSLYIESVKEKIRPEGLKKTRQVFKGDLILSNSMSFGRPYILKIDGCIHDGWLLIRDGNKLFDKVFLCIALSQPAVMNYFMGQARGAVVNNLNKDIVGKMPMYIPPIELQNQFADFVRQVDKSKSEIIEGIMKLKVPQNS